MLSDLLASLSSNPCFDAGAGLIGIGTALAVLRRSSRFGLIFFRRQYMILLEVPNNDNSYTWLLRWISHQLRDSSRHLSARITSIKNEDPASTIDASYSFGPSMGKHYFRYKGKFIQVERTREQMINSGVAFKSVQLTTLGKDRRIYIKDVDHFLSNPHRYIDDESRNSVSTWLSSLRTSWLGRNIGYHRSRGSSISSIRFIHVDPSFFRSFRFEHQHDKLESRDDDGRSSSTVVESCSRKSLILFEYIDAATDGRHYEQEDAVRYEGMKPWTLNGLLDSLDAGISAEGRIIFMTTNFIERLDPALIRPDRVDFKYYIGPLTSYQVEHRLRRFYPAATPLEIEGFLRQIEQFTENYSKQLSAAQLQGFFMHHKESLDVMREHLPDLTGF